LDLQVTRSIGTTVKALESAMASMNLEKISNVMDKFEQQFENLDVHSSVSWLLNNCLRVNENFLQVMEGAMSATTTLQVPEDQVAALMKQIADESGLDMQAALPSVVPASSMASVQEDALTKRCAKEI
jgi:charged multivesicular body protein 1